MNNVFSFVTVCQNKMQVDQEDQKQQAGEGDKKSEAEEMEVTFTVMSIKFQYYLWQNDTAFYRCWAKSVSNVKSQFLFPV